MSRCRHRFAGHDDDSSPRSFPRPLRRTSRGGRRGTLLVLNPLLARLVQGSSGAFERDYCASVGRTGAHEEPLFSGGEGGVEFKADGINNRSETPLPSDQQSHLIGRDHRTGGKP